MAGQQLDKKAKVAEVVKKSRTGKEPIIPAFGVTRREELFCREVTNGSTLTEAYKLAYQPALKSRLKTINSLASNLFHRERVVRRVEELYEQQDSLARLDSDYVITNLISNHRVALEAGDLTSSNKSLELLGRHLNLFEKKPQADEQVASLFSWIASQTGTGITKYTEPLASSSSGEKGSQLPIEAEFKELDT
tara:strand:+ start:2452 stop:3030 length:579 start_codon:yes stop_codon:yes gene_type:complete